VLERVLHAIVVVPINEHKVEHIVFMDVDVKQVVSVEVVSVRVVVS
jgi:hypothetical protein